MFVMSLVCLLLPFCSHYQIVVVAYSPGADFDRNRQPNEVFAPDRFVPYETVSNTCGWWRHVCACLRYSIVLLWL